LRFGTPDAFWGLVIDFITREDVANSSPKQERAACRNVPVKYFTSRKEFLKPMTDVLAIPFALRFYFVRQLFAAGLFFALGFAILPSLGGLSYFAGLVDRTRPGICGVGRPDDWVLGESCLQARKNRQGSFRS
jgi:hypothetical protein